MLFIEDHFRDEQPEDEDLGRKYTYLFTLIKHANLTIMIDKSNILSSRICSVYNKSFKKNIDSDTLQDFYPRTNPLIYVYSFDEE